MQGRLGAMLTSGLAAVAIALAMLQAFVVSRSHARTAQASANPLGPSNRFSAPGNRSAIPWVPFDQPQQPDEARRQPAQKQQEQRRTPPPPSRYHSYPPRIGPAPIRKATA